jgi:hypothetical protein
VNIFTDVQPKQHHEEYLGEKENLEVKTVGPTAWHI